MSPDFPDRQSIRLKGFNYSHNGWYFVTICTRDRQNILGKIVNGNLYKSPMGHNVNWEWIKLRIRHPHIVLDEFVIMPNHVHGIICINDGRENRAPTLGQIIAYFKYQTTKQYNNIIVGAGYSRPCGVARYSRPCDPAGYSRPCGVARYSRPCDPAGFSRPCDSSGSSRPFRKLWQRNYYEHIVRDEQDLNRIREYIRNNPTN